VEKSGYFPLPPLVKAPPKGGLTLLSGCLYTERKIPPLGACMRLPDYVQRAAEKRRVVIYYVDRATVQFWNERRSGKELRYFCGWYWYAQARNGKAETDQHGPFRSESAALRDSFEKLQLRA
jgi:hypothetical protein